MGLISKGIRGRSRQIKIKNAELDCKVLIPMSEIQEMILRANDELVDRLDDIEKDIATIKRHFKSKGEILY